MGAPQSRLLETAIGLKKRGHRVLIVTAMPNYPKGKIFDEYKGKFYLKDTVNDIDTLRYSLYPSNSKKTLPRIISMLSFSFTAMFSIFKIRKFKPDYIFTESPPLTLALSGLLLSKLSGAKHIMNVSDIWPLSALEIGAISKGRVYSILEKVEKYLYVKSFACFGQSQQIIDHINSKGTIKTLLFRNGVDFERFRSIKKIENTSGSSGIRIVYAGLLGVAQGVFDICKNINFRELGVEFHIYGDGAEKVEIETFLNAHPNINIYLHKSVARNLIPETIMQYDITLIPLKMAIFGAVPSKIYEAMAAGLPILFTGGGEGAEIIKSTETGWVCAPSDFKDINSKIKEIATLNNSQLSVYKSNCLKAAENLFNRDIQIDNIDKFFRNGN